MEFSGKDTRMNSATLALALLLLGGVLRPQSLPPGAPPDAVNLPGGVANAAGTVLYLTNLWNGVVALDAQDGRVLWESKEAMHPLALVGKRLVALSGTPDRVVVLDAEGGALVKQTDPVFPGLCGPMALPDASGVRCNFGARARLGEGGVRVEWSATRIYSGGANRGPPFPKGSLDHAAGAFEVDLESCEVKLLPFEADRVSFDEGRPLYELPAQLREIAQLGQWESGRVIGERAYGKIRRLEKGRNGAAAKTFVLIQAVDPTTGKVLWERPYEEIPAADPNSIRQP